MAKSKVRVYRLYQSTKQVDTLEAGFNLLGLEGMRVSFVELAKRATEQKLTPYDFLERLLEYELGWKEENRLKRWRMQARFPWIKTLKEYDYAEQPSVDPGLINELASCRFLDRAENVIFLGQTGVGKTHLSIGLGLEAIQNGYEVRFIKLDQLVDTVDRLTGEGLLLHRFSGVLQRVPLLVVDDIGPYELPLTAGTTTFLSRLFEQRYEKGSVIFTSNKNIKEWEKLFGQRASAVIDRVTHHCTFVAIEGDSHRMKDKLQRFP